MFLDIISQLIPATLPERFNYNKKLFESDLVGIKIQRGRYS